jgi:peptidoglycan/LPS O-acetylase OafA/YrhL
MLKRAEGSSSYIPGLDGVRACAFLLVFFAHAGLQKVWGASGGLGVTVFFFLSGYLITTLLRVEAEKTGTISLKNFYLRRAFRILPPMYITLAVAYSLAAAGVLYARGNLIGFVSASAYFYNYAALLSHKVQLPTGLGVLWSLMVEEHFYLVFPFVYLWFIRRRMSRSAQVSILLGACALALVWRFYLVASGHISFGKNDVRWTNIATDTRFDSILFGCVLAIWHNPWLKDLPPWMERNKGRLALAGAAIMLASIGMRNPYFRESARNTLQGIALYPMFIYVVSATPRWLEWKPMRWVGWSSYTMYLIHVLFILEGNHAFPAHPLIVDAVSFVLALLYAWAMRDAVELPLRKVRVSLEARLKKRKEELVFSAGVTKV